MNPETMTVKQKLTYLNNNGWDAREMAPGQYKVEERSDHVDASFLYGEERVLTAASYIVASRLAKGQSATLPVDF